ncbi:MAG: hypothetical protein IME99_10315, partial [Proteobacteria bacterium]|nr:hypothetical protein [Pseudomonadota bacterium]
MSVSQNEGLQAAAKAVAAIEPRQNQDKGQIEERQHDKPDSKDVSTSNSKAYVVSFTDEAVKRSGDAKESYTGERGGGHKLEQDNLKSGTQKQEVKSATDEAVSRAESGEPAKEPFSVPEEIKSAQVEKPEVKSNFVEPGSVEHEVTSATDEASERAASGEPAKEPFSVPEEVKSAQVEKPAVKSNFVEPGSVEQEVTSATDDASKRAASGEVAERPGAAPGEVQSAQVEEVEVKSNFKEPGTVEQEVTSATDDASKRAASG